MIIRLTGISPLELDRLGIGEKISNVLLGKCQEFNDKESAGDLADAINKLDAINELNIREVWVHRCRDNTAIATIADHWSDLTIIDTHE